MPRLKQLNPVAAVKDLRAFLSTRSKGELIAGMGAIVVSGGLMAVFLLEAQAQPMPQRQITYVQDWPLERSLAQIQAQARIEDARRAAASAELERLRTERRAEFKRIDDALKGYGI